jgi:CRISPR-associated endonuclease Cas1
LPRVGHNLKRLVVIGADGVVSLAALRWLADQKAAFVMLERDGKVLAATGPVRPSDVRLRRAQGLAHHNATALSIARELIGRKLEEQRHVVSIALRDLSAAAAIESLHAQLDGAHTLDDIRRIEAFAAMAYWAAWRSVHAEFPRHQLSRVPAHWLTFTSRHSSLTGSPRLATDPVNAILNYLYAILEAEARLAAATLGLDPGLGVLHADTIARDNLACDLMEPIRPLVDAYVLKWLASEPLRREWFFETRSGNCRLMESLAERLGQTAPTWARAVAPIAERVAQMLWTGRPRRQSRKAIPTTLTQSRKRVAQGAAPEPPPATPPEPPKVCRLCGSSLRHGSYCRKCAVVASTEALVDAAKRGRVVSQEFAAQAKRTATRLKNAQAERVWQPSALPVWLTKDYYDREVAPRLGSLTNRVVRTALDVSEVYAIRVRHGQVRPHARHWLSLAELVQAVPKL